MKSPPGELLAQASIAHLVSHLHITAAYCRGDLLSRPLFGQEVCALPRVCFASPPKPG